MGVLHGWIRVYESEIFPIKALVNPRPSNLPSRLCSGIGADWQPARCGTHGPGGSAWFPPHPQRGWTGSTASRRCPRASGPCSRWSWREQRRQRQCSEQTSPNWKRVSSRSKSNIIHQQVDPCSFHVLSWRILVFNISLRLQMAPERQQLAETWTRPSQKLKLRWKVIPTTKSNTADILPFFPDRLTKEIPRKTFKNMRTSIARLEVIDWRGLSPGTHPGAVLSTRGGRAPAV